MFEDINDLSVKPEISNSTKPLLCDVTLKYLINDCKERLKILEERKQTPITLGRINEMQCLIVHLQQFVLDNIINNVVVVLLLTYRCL